MPKITNQDRLNPKLVNKNTLNAKLKERLGYFGIFSQRNSRFFLSNLSISEQQELLEKLKVMYAQIITNYFTNEEQINYQIDRFVEEAFFVNLSLGQVVEIHMELIDNLEHQLKLEGLHPEHLCDYRLTLIDVIAHLGEMYRSVLTDNCVVNG
jgi:circadian clock protein KaiA